MVKTQRSFDKAYKHSIRLFLLGLTTLYMVFAGLAIYLASNDRFFNVIQFEQTIMGLNNIGWIHHLEKGMGFFSILLSSIPLSFSNIIDLLVLMHTNFAEWDVHIQQANIEFIYPHATLAFGKVAHMFFSRTALQRDDKQSVKVFHVGGHFFLNKVNQYQWEKLKAETNENTFSDSEEDHEEGNESEFQEENSLDYLPNELKFTPRYINDEANKIL